ncbi:hypothetical protein DM02DRAFT_607799 [Periconia macrospinosa]|uniref:Uncharacterized protein n=1 Tax=Periconia macrospinosa TaxID=97972 RepID=A0A2V1ECX3_9PLEO|nr:hypothetical protein DM02DRAFT_607799 [Periconia macrospinosa]
MESTKARSASVSSYHTTSRQQSKQSGLSTFGMTRPTPPQSPDEGLRPGKFARVGLPSSPRPSDPPLTPMSPPMSARSFGTVIDSEPSTPAYSPRSGSSWDDSRLVLLPPVPSSPTTPAEPVWDMMVPIQKAPKKRPLRFSMKPSLSRQPTTNSEKDVDPKTALSSHPAKPKHLRSQSEKEILHHLYPPSEKEQESEEVKSEGETQNAPPLDRLALKMKQLLRRKSDTDRRSTDKKWKNYELQRMETSHWTEL